MNVDFKFDSVLTKPTDELPSSYDHKGTNVPAPSQTADGEEYICGNSGPEYLYANVGRDQDRSRSDERVPAQGCSRYVS